MADDRWLSWRWGSRQGRCWLCGVCIILVFSFEALLTSYRLDINKVECGKKDWDKHFQIRSASTHEGKYSQGIFPRTTVHIWREQTLYRPANGPTKSNKFYIFVGLFVENKFWSLRIDICVVHTNKFFGWSQRLFPARVSYMPCDFSPRVCRPFYVEVQIVNLEKQHRIWNSNIKEIKWHK